MGGAGSGRTAGTEKIVGNILGTNQPAPTSDDSFYLPNYSGVQTAALKTSAPLGGGAVDSVFTRTGDVVATTNDYTWAQIDKTTSSIADITTRAISDTTGTLAIARGGTGDTTATAAFDALAPTTTEGDIIYYNGTDNVRLAKGSDNQVLTATATTINWEAAAGGGSVDPILDFGFGSYYPNTASSAAIPGTNMWDAITETDTTSAIAASDEFGGYWLQRSSNTLDSTAVIEMSDQIRLNYEPHAWFAFRSPKLTVSGGELFAGWANGAITQVAGSAISYVGLYLSGALSTYNWIHGRASATETLIDTGVARTQNWLIVELNSDGTGNVTATLFNSGGTVLRTDTLSGANVPAIDTEMESKVGTAAESSGAVETQHYFGYIRQAHTSGAF